MTTVIIAERLARARRDLGWTLSAAASHAGVSVAHLSRIEKGSRQPSIGLLIQLGRAYRLSLGELVGEEPRRAIHVVRREEPTTHEAPGGRYASLSGIVGQNLLEAVRFDLRPHTSTSKNSRHTGEEWLYVLSGELRLVQGSNTVDLQTGDAAHLDAQVPHHLHNGTDQDATVLLVTAGTGPSKVNGHASLEGGQN